MGHNPHNHTSGFMFIIAATLLLILPTYLFKDFEKSNEQQQLVNSVINKDGTRVIIIRQNRHRQFAIAGRINGISVPFIIDTGATHVSIPSKLAKKLRLPRLYKMRARTANGTVTVYATKIKQLILGPIVLSNIKANINPGMHNQPVLLGMSALSKLEFRHRGGILQLIQHPKGASINKKYT